MGVLSRRALIRFQFITVECGPGLDGVSSLPHEGFSQDYTASPYDPARPVSRRGPVIPVWLPLRVNRHLNIVRAIAGEVLTLVLSTRTTSPFADSLARGAILLAGPGMLKPRSTDIPGLRGRSDPNKSLDRLKFLVLLIYQPKLGRTR
jgi:hypothetical protein